MPNAHPVAVVERWSKAINAGDDQAAADLFADHATVIQGGHRIKLAGRGEALSFNMGLPCGGRIVQRSVSGDAVTATFALTQRPGHVCDGPGQDAVARFRIADGKIVVWHQLPTPAANTQTA